MEALRIFIILTIYNKNGLTARLVSFSSIYSSIWLDPSEVYLDFVQS